MSIKTCIGDPLYDSNKFKIAIVLVVFSVISVISSSIVVFFYCAYNRMRREFLSFLIFLLAVLDILCWLNIIITASYYLEHGKGINCVSNDFCVFMGFIWSLSELLNYGVTLLISLSLYMALMKNIDPAQYKNRMLIGVFVISFIFALLPFWWHANRDLVYDNNLTDMAYGPVDDFKCWITNREARITIFYIPMWLVIVLNTSIMIIFLKGLHLQMFDELHDRYHTRFTMFPVIMMICYVVSSIRRIIQLCTGNDDTNFYLDLFMYILMPLQGFFNTIVFGMFEEFIRVRIKAFILCDWQKLRELKDQETEEEAVSQDQGFNLEVTN